MRKKTFLSSVKELIIKYWYVLPVSFVLLLILYFTAPRAVLDALLILLLLILILLIVTWVVLLVNKKWLQFTISFVASIVIVGGMGVFFLYAIAQGLSEPDNDPFGKDHPIPANLEYNLPLDKFIVEVDSFDNEWPKDLDSLVSPVDIHDPNTYLNIWNDSQGGIYTYDFFYGPLPAGEIYLKCFEVTENIPLSETRISKESRVETKPTNSFSKVVNQQRFFIYEGVWRDYYAARIEVWFKDAKTKEEKKLLEKVYRVEGWMR